MSHDSYPFWFPIRKFDDHVGLHKNFRYLEDFMRSLHAGSGVPTVTVAANDSEAISKGRADYTCNGTDDHVTIQAAINSLTENGDYRIVFLEGTYNVGAEIFFGSGRVTIQGIGLPTFNVALFNGDLFSLDGISMVSGLRFTTTEGDYAFHLLVSGSTSLFMLIENCIFDLVEGRACIRPRMSQAEAGWIVRNCYFTNINLSNGAGVTPQGLVWSDDGGPPDRYGIFTGNRIDDVTFSHGNGRIVYFNGDETSVICMNNVLTNIGGVGRLNSTSTWSHNDVEGTYVAGTHTGLTLSHDSDLTGVSSDDHHTKSHVHDGDDGSGTVDHTDLTTIGSNTHANVDDFLDFFNGTFMEAFDATVSESSGTVSLDLAKVGGGNLTARFSSGLTTHTAGAIVLTAGSDTSPTENFIYILESDSTTLVKDTGNWPAAEHIKVAYLVVPTAVFVAANGPYVNQNWNDFAMNAAGQGHMSHHTERTRRTGAAYFSGIDGNGSQGYLTPTAGAVDLISTAGIVYQMHEHTFDAFTTVAAASVALVKNWSGDAYHDISNLYDIVRDSGNNLIGNNKYFNLVIWGVANKTGEYSPLMINLPSGFYHTASAAASDDDGFDDFSIPTLFNTESSTGFLIARITARMKTGGGTWDNIVTTDLRGFGPLTASGGAAAALTEFADNAFEIHDETDESRRLHFSVGGISADTVRVVTAQDADGVMALLGPNGDLSVDQASTSGALPVITLDQADVDEDFFKLIGTSDTNVDRALVDAANFTTPGAIVGWLKINIQDDQATDPIVDGDYYIPFYGAPSA